MLKVSPLRPGLLVALRTSVTGNVSYETEVLQSERLTDTGSKEAEWKTKRTTADPEEFERAIKIRGRVRNILRSVCAYSDFGLLCPEANADQLDKAMEEAKAIADKFNAEANLTRVEFSMLTGKLMTNDERAVKAITKEVDELLQAMEQGVRNMDPEVIRENAKKARSLGAMLSDAASQAVKDAIAAARATASKIAKAGEQASLEVDRSALEAIASARTAFLDLEEGGEIQAPTETGRGVDLLPAEVDPSVFAQMAGAEAFKSDMQRVVPEQWQAKADGWLAGYDTAKRDAEGTPNDPREASDLYDAPEIPNVPAPVPAAIDLDESFTPALVEEVLGTPVLGTISAKTITDIVSDGNLLPKADPRIGRYEMILGGDNTTEFEVISITGDVAMTDFGPMPERRLDQCKRIGDLSEAGRQLQAMGNPLALAAQLEKGE